MSDNVRCSCKHEFQDSRYGRGIRATTPMKNGQLRCTVCGMVHSSQTTVAPTKIKEPVVAKSTPPKSAEATKSAPTEKVQDKKPDEKKKKSLKGNKR